MNVAIIYGWSEGSWQGKRLRTELHKHGFHITKSVKQADVIIAHSGGCYLLAEESRARLILLVGLPYHPTKHPVRSLQSKIRRELKDSWWFRKTFFNTYYLFSKPRRWYRIWRARKQSVLPEASEEVPIIAIRNEQDDFMHATSSADLANKKGWKLQSLSGHHDDLWINPAPYVQIIKKALAT